MIPQIALVGSGAVDYIGQALALYRGFEASGQDHQTVILDSCTMFFEIGEIKITDDPPAGIIFRPRSGAVVPVEYDQVVSDGLGGISVQAQYLPGVAGGWGNGEIPLATKSLFPLTDDDGASFVTSLADDGATIDGDFADDGDFGNLYWTNGKTGDDLVILSWRGTPTRHFPVPSDTQILGFSMFETAQPGAVEDTPEYTAFGTELYQAGEATDAPLWSWPYNGSAVGGKCLILGAMQDAAGIIYIVTQSDHYNAPQSAKLGSSLWHDLSKPGFWLTLWKTGTQVNGWDLVMEASYGRNGLPWFGNSDGTVFMCSNGDNLTFDGVLTPNKPLMFVTTEFGVTLAAKFANYSETSIDNSAADIAIVVECGANEFQEFAGNALAFSLVRLNFTAISIIKTTPSVSTTLTGPFPLLSPAPSIPPAVNCVDNFWVITGGDGIITVEVDVAGVWVPAGPGPYRCHVEQVCPGITINYQAFDECKNHSAVSFGTSVGPSSPPAPIVVTGPDAWSGNIGDYSATGGVAPYTWTPPTGCGMGDVVAQCCPDGEGGFAYTGSLPVRMPSGYWKPIADQGYGVGVSYANLAAGYGGAQTTVTSGNTQTITSQGLSFNVTSTLGSDIVPISNSGCPGCRSVNNVWVSYTKGTGEDYLPGGSSLFSGSAASCCIGARGPGESYNAYFMIYIIHENIWTCP